MSAAESSLPSHLTIEHLDGKEVMKKTLSRVKGGLEEASILLALQGHANIIQLHRIELHEGDIELTMERIPRTLLDVVQDPSQQLSAQEFGRIAVQLIEVVSHIHDRGYIHKDIKLENILIRDGHIHLIDFGFARSFIRGQASIISRKGSLHYAAPEIWHREAHEGPEADIWALGVVLYLLATGYFPFGGENPDEIYANIMQPLWIPPGLAENTLLISLLQEMLQTNRTARISMTAIKRHPWVTMMNPAHRASPEETGALQRNEAVKQWTGRIAVPPGPNTYRGSYSPKVRISQTIQPSALSPDRLAETSASSSSAAASSSSDPKAPPSLLHRIKFYFKIGKP